jgi:hypothetical protein
MLVIDCDAHVEESVESWQYLHPDYYLLCPIPMYYLRIPASAPTTYRM